MKFLCNNRGEIGFQSCNLKKVFNESRSNYSGQLAVLWPFKTQNLRVCSYSRNGGIAFAKKANFVK